jgi:hypothetical protein
MLIGGTVYRFVVLFGTPRIRSCGGERISLGPELFWKIVTELPELTGLGEHPPFEGQLPGLISRVDGSIKAASAGMGHTTIPATPMLAIMKDSVQANKQQQALAVNANPWTRRLGIVAPLFVLLS